jgi:hypothetical protein
MATTQTQTQTQTVAPAEAEKPVKLEINARILPPTVKYEGMNISYERLEEAYHMEWPERKHLEVPQFTADANPDDVVEGLKRVGGVVVRGVVSQESLQQMEKDIRPALEADEPWDDG